MSIDHVELTPTQQGVANTVLDRIKQAEKQCLVLIEGVSGVGKSTVVDSVSSELTENGGLIMEPYDVNSMQDTEAKGLTGHLVIPQVLTQIDRLASRLLTKFPNAQVVNVPLPGMSEQEMAIYAQGVLNKGELTDQERIQYSLGIPHIAEQISLPGITRPIATHIAAGFLRENFMGRLAPEAFAEACARFLQVPLLDEIQAGVVKIFSKAAIYENLHFVFHEQQILARKGIREESPLFLASESEGMYDKMLNDRRDAWIEIYASALKPEELDRIHQSTGLVQTRHTYEYQYSARRMRMFLATERKVRFRSQTPEGEIYIHRNDSEEWNVREEFEQYERMLLKNRIPIEHTKKGETGRFHALAQDHEQMVTNPAHVGWMLESLLQQLGIRYFAHNRMLGADYVYDPDTQNINVLKQHDKNHRPRLTIFDSFYAG